MRPLHKTYTSKDCMYALFGHTMPVRLIAENDDELAPRRIWYIWLGGDDIVQLEVMRRYGDYYLQELHVCACVERSSATCAILSFPMGNVYVWIRPSDMGGPGTYHCVGLDRDFRSNDLHTLRVCNVPTLSDGSA